MMEKKNNQFQFGKRLGCGGILGILLLIGIVCNQDKFASQSDKVIPIPRTPPQSDFAPNSTTISDPKPQIQKPKVDVFRVGSKSYESRSDYWDSCSAEFELLRQNEDKYKGKRIEWEVLVSYIDENIHGELPVNIPFVDVFGKGDVIIMSDNDYSYQAARALGKFPRVHNKDLIHVIGTFEGVTDDNQIIIAAKTIRNIGH